MKKTDKTEPEAAAAAPALPDHVLRDEFAGRGGSYTYDPVRAARVPCEITQARHAAEEKVSDE